jgi:hypothetical protein
MCQHDVNTDVNIDVDTEISTDGAGHTHPTEDSDPTQD